MVRSLIILVVLSFVVFVRGSLAVETDLVKDAVARERITALATQLTEFDKRIEQRFDAANHAVSVANGALEKRLDGMNEFRGQLRDQQATYATKSDVDLRLNAITEKLNRLQTRMDNAEGQVAGMGNLWGYMLGAAGLAFALFTLLNRRRNGPSRESQGK